MDNASETVTISLTKQQAELLRRFFSSDRFASDRVQEQLLYDAMHVLGHEEGEETDEQVDEQIALIDSLSDAVLDE